MIAITHEAACKRRLWLIIGCYWYCKYVEVLYGVVVLYKALEIGCQWPALEVWLCHAVHCAAFWGPTDQPVSTSIPQHSKTTFSASWLCLWETAEGLRFCLNRCLVFALNHFACGVPEFWRVSLRIAILFLTNNTSWWPNNSTALRILHRLKPARKRCNQGLVTNSIRSARWWYLHQLHRVFCWIFAAMTLTVEETSPRLCTGLNQSLICFCTYVRIIGIVTDPDAVSMEEAWQIFDHSRWLVHG